MRPFLVTVTISFFLTSYCPTVIFYTVAVKFLRTSLHQLTSPFPFSSLYFGASCTMQLLLFLYSVLYFIALLHNFETSLFSIPLLREFIYFALFHSLCYFSLLYFYLVVSSSSQVPFLHSSSSSRVPFHFDDSLHFAPQTFPRSDHFSSQYFILHSILTSVHYLYVRCLFQLY